MEKLNPPEKEMRNRSDINEAQLREFCSLSSNVAGLLELVETSRRYLGFFTRTSSRAFEYPWIIDQIDQKPKCYCVDVGAGVSPVPLVLSERGHKVVTVDNSTRTVQEMDKEHWNEWGFLDYARLKSDIMSTNSDFTTSSLASESANVVYSISVFEHLLAEVRRTAIKRTHDILVSEGRLLLTVDLQPNSYRLWNRVLGKVIEDETEHGLLDDMLQEVDAVGFRIDTLFIKRAIPVSATDIAFLTASKM